NFGTLTLDGNLALSAGASLVNEESGLLDLTGDRALTTSGIADVTVVNRGLLRKSAGTGTAALGGTFTNAGTVEVLAGTLNLTGAFTNFTGGTLAGGTYLLFGTLRFTSARITRNDATVFLSGLNAQILDGAGVNALTTLTVNSALGGLYLDGGRSLTL